MKSLAAFDLLIGVRVRWLAATLTLLLACSGGGEEAATPEPDTDASDSSIGRDASDARSNVADHADRSAQPPDAAKPDSAVADVGAADVAFDVPVLALCLRLMDPQNKGHELQLSQAVNDQYLLLIQADCRVYKTNFPPGGAPAFAAWRNVLYAYNLDLWGCSDKTATGFALVSSALTGVSSADTNQLIELYLKAATKVLELSAREVADLRRDLQRLAGPLVTNESTDYTLSNCPQDASPPIDAPGPVDASAPDASDAARFDAEAGPAEAQAGPIDAEAGPADSGAGSPDAEGGSAVADAGSVDGEGGTVDAGDDASDAAEEAMDAAQGDEGGEG